MELVPPRRRRAQLAKGPQKVGAHPTVAGGGAGVHILGVGLSCEVDDAAAFAFGSVTRLFGLISLLLLLLLLLTALTAKLAGRAPRTYGNTLRSSHRRSSFRLAGKACPRWILHTSTRSDPFLPGPNLFFFPSPLGYGGGTPSGLVI